MSKERGKNGEILYLYGRRLKKILYGNKTSACVVIYYMCGGSTLNTLRKSREVVVASFTPLLPKL